MKYKELYDFFEKMLGPSLTELGFEQASPPRAFWFKPIKAKFLNLHIEGASKFAWSLYDGGVFYCRLGITDEPKQKGISLENQFTFDTFLSDSQLQERIEIQNGIIKKIVSQPGYEEWSRGFGGAPKELFLMEIRSGFQRNSGGQFRFLDSDDVKCWSEVILKDLPSILCEVEIRLFETQTTSAIP